MQSARLRLAVIALAMGAGPLAGQGYSGGYEVESALLPLPASLRAEATVLGYGPDGRFVTVREGGNGLVCEIQDPEVEATLLFCYQESMRPLREARRNLLVEGRAASEITEMLNAEVAEGTLTAPPAATAYLLRGPAGCVDRAARTLCEDANLVYMIYTPMMTTETLGLPREREGDAPYMHAEGTVWSHIMVEPPAGGGL